MRALPRATTWRRAGWTRSGSGRRPRSCSSTGAASCRACRSRWRPGCWRCPARPSRRGGRRPAIRRSPVGDCRLDLYSAWRLLTAFEAPDRCVLLLVAEHTRSASPYRLLYEALASTNPKSPGPSHHAATPTGSHPSTPTSPNDSSAACENSAPPVPEHPLSGRHAPGPHHRVRPGRRDPPRARPRLHPAVAGRRPPPSEQAEGEPEHGRSRPEPGPIRGSRAASDTRDVRNRFPRLSPEKSRTHAASCRYGGGGIARDRAGSGARPVPDSRSSGVALAEEVSAGSDQDDGPDRRDQELRPR